MSLFLYLLLLFQRVQSSKSNIRHAPAQLPSRLWLRLGFGCGFGFGFGIEKKDIPLATLYSLSRIARSLSRRSVENSLSSQAICSFHPAALFPLPLSLCAGATTHATCRDELVNPVPKLSARCDSLHASPVTNFLFDFLRSRQCVNLCYIQYRSRSRSRNNRGSNKFKHFATLFDFQTLLSRPLPAAPLPRSTLSWQLPVVPDNASFAFWTLTRCIGSWNTCSTI